MRSMTGFNISHRPNCVQKAPMSVPHYWVCHSPHSLRRSVHDAKRRSLASGNHIFSPKTQFCLGGFYFSNNMMDMVPLKERILKSIQDIPVGLQWKMINMGTQGSVKLEGQICTLHIYVDELDLTMAKPLLMALYESCPSVDHVFPLHVQMWLVPEINLVLNIKGCKNVEKLQVCWNTQSKIKLSYIKTSEIELLDSQSGLLGMPLWDAMMSIQHPMNPKFALFHLVNKSWREWCYILTNTCHDFCTLTIPAMEDHKRKGDEEVAPLIAKWFKPATQVVVILLIYELFIYLFI